MVLTTTGRTPAAGASYPGPVRADDPATPPVDDGWGIILDFLGSICLVLGCSTGDVRPDADSPLTSAAREKAIRGAEDQITRYTSRGVLPGLSLEERSQGVADAESFEAFLGARPDLFPASLHSRYLKTLECILDDLRQ